MHIVVWFQVFLSNANNYLFYNDYYYLIIVIFCTQSCFQVTNNNSKQL